MHYKRKCSGYIGDLPQVGIPIVTLRFEYFGFGYHYKHSSKIVSEILPTSYRPLYIRLTIRFFNYKNNNLNHTIPSYVLGMFRM